ncbi:DUF2891 family protein [Brevundimonas sp. DWR2-3-1b1]|uniref:DUF2891 family protein n=1 Tax=unclassified Brevundimonas TaxID=2622653 RepID=UPI003CFB3857
MPTRDRPCYRSRHRGRARFRIAHLDGLNLSRGWCWRAIAAALSSLAPLQAAAATAAERHLDAALPHSTGDYMGEHWLPSFALLALMPPTPDKRLSPLL